MFWKIILIVYLVVSLLVFALCWLAGTEASKLLKERYPDKQRPKRSLLSRMGGILRSIIICSIPLLNFGMLIYISIYWEESFEKVMNDIEKTLIPKEVQK